MEEKKPLDRQSNEIMKKSRGCKVIGEIINRPDKNKRRNHIFFIIDKIENVERENLVIV